MEIVNYRKMIQSCHAAKSVKLVLLDAIKLARESDSGREFVDPVDVLLTFHKYTFVNGLKQRLNGVGLTFDMLEDCLAGMDRQMSNCNSRLATERMLVTASASVADRAPTFEGAPPFGLGDLMWACIVAGSCVIDTVIRDGLQLQTSEVLAAVDAPQYFQLMASVQEVMQEAQMALVSMPD